MHRFKVRKARLGDIENMTTIWLNAMQLHEKWDSRCKLMDDAESSFKSALKKSLQGEQGDCLWLVAEKGSSIGGIGEAYIQSIAPPFCIGKKGWISFIGVKPEFKRNRVGTMLLEEYKKWFKSRGISQLELSVVESNSVGVSFWQKNGFAGFTKKMTLKL